ncbi:MAG TPA: hypothetical protein VIE43_23040 [Thermoanaerobaculia bacterium]|nr:hypothetical protein [Thermoanaerobaculia bacterium]
MTPLTPQPPLPPPPTSHTGKGLALLRSLRLSLSLLLGRRLFVFLGVDLLVLGYLLLNMLLESEGDAGDLFRYAFLVPSLLLALPALAGLVDLERRASCLDLALSVPAAEAYFVRRAGAVCVVVAVQGFLVMLLGWFLGGREFPLLAPLFQVLVVSLFLGAVSLFWAVRLRTAGAVWLASAATAGVASPWLFANPIPPRFFTHYGQFLPGGEESLPWLRSLAILAVGAVLFYLYARRRLRRPERMLS